MKRSTAIVLIIVLVVLSVACYLLFTGPRMYVTPHVRAYQAVMPPTPRGSVPVASARVPLPTPEEAESLANPVEPTAENLSRAKVYYGYYCIFCHGAAGAGNGPVGESFFPNPADLRAAKVRRLSDGKLLRACFTGVGHKNVMDRVVPAEWRWHLVLYVRELGKEASPPR